MRGEVTHYDEAQGFGFIAGSDGNRYTFARENLRRAAATPKGTPVEFTESGSQARDIFPVREMGATPPTLESQAPAQRTSPHFGRMADNGLPAGTGLWSYFWRGLTVNYANFRGRARRKEYWGYFLFWLLALCAISAAAGFADASAGNFDRGEPYLTIGTIGVFLLGTLIPGIAATVRRLHDIGLAGWFFLLIFIPYLGNLIIFVFALIPSQKHDNKWGPIPPGIDRPSAFTPAPEIPR